MDEFCYGTKQLHKLVFLLGALDFSYYSEQLESKHLQWLITSWDANYIDYHGNARASNMRYNCGDSFVQGNKKNYKVLNQADLVQIQNITTIRNKLHIILPNIVCA